MLFTTPEERSRYFERGQANLGDAMHHASSTTLGAFGNVSDLQFDCANVMLLEMQSYVAQNHPEHKELWYEVTADQIGYCRAFREAFESARHEDSAMANNLVRSLGDNIGHMDYIDPKLPRDKAVKLKCLHGRIFAELAISKTRSKYDENYDY